MRMRSVAVLAAIVLVGCEDGPEQIFQPNTGNPAEQNGHDGNGSWVQEGNKGFDEEVGTEDAAGRARFCNEDESTALLQNMVAAAILPDESVGLIPLWDPDTGGALHADQLVGLPEDGKFCDPWGVYSNAFTWGPTQEIIVFFDDETRLVEGIAVTDQYLGTLSGTFEKDDATTGSVVFKTRDRIKIDGVVLTKYTSDANQASEPDAWMNHANVSAMYRMIRETFFNDPGDPPLGDSFDCVAAKLCDLIWETDNQATPQSTWIVFVDSGIQLGVSPEGHVNFVWAEPVRVAPFELGIDIDFINGGETAPSWTSSTEAGCSFSLTEDLTWGTFKTRCTPAASTLARINYNVWTMRDAVTAEFNGIEVSFMRDIVANPVLFDGEAPADSDVLLDVFFTRSLNATLAQFKPNTLALAYADKLQKQLAQWVDPAYAPSHPFDTGNYVVTVPSLTTMPDDPQPIGELLYDSGSGVMKSWVTEVVDQVQDYYHTVLTPTEQAAVDLRIIESVYLIQPFVDVVLAELSDQKSEDPTQSLKRFRTTDNKRWSIGYAHWRDSAGQAYRMVVQYSLNFGAITAVGIERGLSKVDEIFEGVLGELNTINGGTAEPYYTIDMCNHFDNPYKLGAGPILVHSFDRQLNTLDVTLSTWDSSGTGSIRMTVPGTPIEDNGGYLRQIRGERYEWVPANSVGLYGKETSLTLYVEPNGAVTRIVQWLYKGTVDLCPGLPIRQGDNVPEAIDAWVATQGTQAFHNCEIVFNYSENGNILDEVVSLNSRIGIVTYDSRAVSASMWK